MQFSQHFQPVTLFVNVMECHVISQQRLCGYVTVPSPFVLESTGWRALPLPAGACHAFCECHGVSRNPTALWLSPSSICSRINWLAGAPSPSGGLIGMRIEIGEDCLNPWDFDLNVRVGKALLVFRSLDHESQTSNPVLCGQKPKITCVTLRFHHTVTKSFVPLRPVTQLCRTSILSVS